MSVQSEITRIQNAVDSAIAAIKNKGVSVPTAAGVADLATYIAKIVTGSTGYTVKTGNYKPSANSSSISIEHGLGKKPVGLCVICSFAPSTTSNYYVIEADSVSNKGFVGRGTSSSKQLLTASVTETFTSTTAVLEFSNSSYWFITSTYNYIVWG